LVFFVRVVFVGAGSAGGATCESAVFRGKAVDGEVTTEDEAEFFVGETAVFPLPITCVYAVNPVNNAALRTPMISISFLFDIQNTPSFICLYYTVSF